MTDLVLPAMGEGIIEAEITRWLIREGDPVETGQAVVEVATDKVDSEVTSPGDGIMHKIIIREGDTVRVGQVMAVISSGNEEELPHLKEQHGKDGEEAARGIEISEDAGPESPRIPDTPSEKSLPEDPVATNDDRNYKPIGFLSPVIRKIATENNISPQQLLTIRGSGRNGRITRFDLLTYIKNAPGQETEPDRGQAGSREPEPDPMPRDNQDPGPVSKPRDSRDSEPDPSGQLIGVDQVYGTGENRIEEMDRMRKLIADHMVYSSRTAPHVSSFVEADVTELVLWRNRVKDAFLRKYKQKLTLTTLIIEAVCKALKYHPGINVSVDGYRIIHKKQINIGMATALPDGNLIVPVIHDADVLNLGGLAERVNDLADRARKGGLKPPEITGGTFTVTNMGQFGNLTGTPIINQPQVAILAAGSILKKPGVVETPDGDTIGIRQMLILSLSYDHRVVDGALGGMFLKRIGDLLQEADPDREI